MMNSICANGEPRAQGPTQGLAGERDEEALTRRMRRVMLRFNFIHSTGG